VNEATGDAVEKMLKEIEETDRIKNPYCLSSAEIEQRIGELRQHMANIRTNIETVWRINPSVEFRDRTVTVFDLMIVSSTVTAISFIGCQSKEWVEIGHRLAAMPQLKELSA
jgi:hypothetical protein